MKELFHRMLPFGLSLLMACSPSWTGTPEEAFSRCRALMETQEYDRAMEVALGELARAEEKKDLCSKAEALCLAARIDLKAMRDPEAWERACAAEETARSAHLARPLAEALILKGSVCAYANLSPEFNRDEEALGYLEEALSVATRAGCPDLHAEACFHLSEVYVNKNRWNDVLVSEFYDQAGAYLAEGEAVARADSLTGLIRLGMPFRIRYLRQGGGLEEAVDYCNEVLSSCGETDWLSRQQILDQLTVMNGELGRPEASLENHRQYVYAMQQYIRSRSNTQLQEMEGRYDLILKQRQIDRIRYYSLLLAFLLLLSGVVIFLVVRRNRAVLRRNTDLESVNQAKEKLLAFLSGDLAHPSVAQREALRAFAENCRSMSDGEIRSFSENLVRDAKTLDEDVAQYVYEVGLRRKEAAGEMGLTGRELEIVRLSSRGLSAAAIAEKLHISPRTVNNHKQNIYAKLGVKNNAEMVFKAREAGLV